MVELLDESMLFQCTSKADLEDWVRDINRLRGGDLTSGQLLPDFPNGQDVYDGVYYPSSSVLRPTHNVILGRRPAISAYWADDTQA